MAQQLPRLEVSPEFSPIWQLVNRYWTTSDYPLNAAAPYQREPYQQEPYQPWSERKKRPKLTKYLSPNTL
jgi:hypothetical protein